MRVCAKLRHPNIVHYLGTVVRSNRVHGDTMYICLEYASGGTLSDRIDRHLASKRHFEQVGPWSSRLGLALL